MSNLESQKQQNSEDWRQLMTSRERYIHMLEHGIRVDCTFVIGPDDEEAQEFRAHRLQLSNASAVFDAMLLENIPIDTVHVRCRISDLSPRIFQLILRHVYRDEADMETFEESHELLIAAHKYEMVPLGDACVKYIGNQLKPDNVWKSMQVAMLLKNEPLLKLNLEVLQSQTTLCLATEAFQNAPEECVSKMLDQDELNVESEMELVIAVVRWARSAAQKRGLTGTDTAVRTVLETCLLSQLRLLTLTPQQVTNELHDHGDWLTGEEKWALIKCLLNQNCDALPLNLSSSLRKRAIPEPIQHQKPSLQEHCVQNVCCTSPDGLKYVPCLHSNFLFQAKKQCQLIGLRLSNLYGPVDFDKLGVDLVDTYITNIDVKVQECGKNVALERPKQILYHKVTYKLKTGYNSIIELFFPGDGIHLSIHNWYVIEVVFNDGSYFTENATNTLSLPNHPNEPKFYCQTDCKSIQEHRLSKNDHVFQSIFFSNNKPQ